MIILVDMDGVIADWNSEYDRLLDLAGQSAMEIPRTDNQHTFDLFKDRTEEQKKVVLGVMNHPGFYRDLEPIPGAKEALEEMLALGHTVYLVSSPFPSNPTCASDKYDWVMKHYGEEWTKRLILTMDKTAVVGDVLIDDKPEVKGQLDPEWIHVVFDRLWNQDVNGRPRLFGWSDWKKIVLPLRYSAL